MNNISENKKNLYKEVFAIEKKDLEKLREYFYKKDKIVILAMINIGVNVALRYSDLSHLNFEDITSSNTIYLKEKKTKKKREIKLNKECVRSIEILKEYYKEMGNCFYQRGLIFKSLHRGYIAKIVDSPLTIQSFNRYLKEAQKELNISYNIGSHSLRKTWGKFYYEQYQDIAAVMKILNHSSAGVTLRYIGLDRAWLHRVYENFII